MASSYKGVVVPPSLTKTAGGQDLYLPFTPGSAEVIPGNLQVGGNLEVEGSSTLTGAVSTGDLTSLSVAVTGSVTAGSVTTGSLSVPAKTGMGTAASPLAINIGGTGGTLNLVGNKAWVTLTNPSAPTPAFFTVINPSIASGVSVPIVYTVTPTTGGNFYAPYPVALTISSAGNLTFSTADASLTLCIVTV